MSTLTNIGNELLTGSQSTTD